jgi:hypothetical protein
MAVFDTTAAGSRTTAGRRTADGRTTDGRSTALSSASFSRSKGRKGSSPFRLSRFSRFTSMLHSTHPSKAAVQRQREHLAEEHREQYLLAVTYTTWHLEAIKKRKARQEMDMINMKILIDAASEHKTRKDGHRGVQQFAATDFDPEELHAQAAVINRLIAAKTIAAGGKVVAGEVVAPVRGMRGVEGEEDPPLGEQSTMKKIGASLRERSGKLWTVVNVARKVRPRPLNAHLRAQLPDTAPPPRLSPLCPPLPPFQSLLRAGATLL